MKFKVLATNRFIIVNIFVLFLHNMFASPELVFKRLMRTDSVLCLIENESGS